MARPVRNDIDYFPKWNPTRIIKTRIFDSMSKKEALKAFRSSSSGFISNKKVREFILEKCNNQCVKCGSKVNLQIDHIVSVYSCFHNKKFEFCNTLENLQILCNSCNAKKTP